MRWTRQRRARGRDRRAGLWSVSEHSVRTTGTDAYGKTVWSWHPLLVSSRRRCVDPTGFRQSFNPPATEARRIRLRGELGISRKTIAQGMSDALRCPVCSCASHHSFAHETAGAARTRHSLRPLTFLGEMILQDLGRAAPRDRGGVPTSIRHFPGSSCPALCRASTSFFQSTKKRRGWPGQARP